jgi:hypothetical protein
VAIAVIGAVAVVVAALITSGFGLLSNDSSTPGKVTLNNANGGGSRNTGACVSGGVVVEGTINCSPAARHRFEARFQRQVAATCSSVRSLSKRNTLLSGATISQPDLQNMQGMNSFHLDRAAVISGEREKLAAIKRRLRLLAARPVPVSLRDKANAERSRARSYVRDSSAVVTAFAKALPSSPTLDQVNAAAAPLRDRKDEATAGLEDALTQLAGRDCSLPSTWPAGSA